MSAHTENHGNLWRRIQYCDPRWLYALFALMVIICEFWRPAMPTVVPPAVQRLYDTIERLPTDKLVIIDSELAASIRAECEGQFVAVVRHLFRKGLRFAVMTWTTQPEGIKYAVDLTAELARECGKEYGRDYVIWNPLTPAGGAMLQAFARDIPGVVKTDLHGTPLSAMPVMRGVSTIKDVALVYKVSYVWDRAETPWIGFIQSVYGTPYACGTVSIMSSSAYPFLDSGQLCGMLAGAAGAAAYERLMHAPGIGLKTVTVQSFAVLFVLVAIVLGNIAMLLARRGEPRSPSTKGGAR